MHASPDRENLFADVLHHGAVVPQGLDQGGIGYDLAILASIGVLVKERLVP